MDRKSSIILFIIACITITGCEYEDAAKKDCCTALTQRVNGLQDKVSIWLGRFNALHSLTSRFGREILEKDLPGCQFQQMIDEPLKFRVIVCPQLMREIQPAYPDTVITDIFIIVRQKMENVYTNDAWEWRIREVNFATK